MVEQHYDNRSVVVNVSGQMVQEWSDEMSTSGSCFSFFKGGSGSELFLLRFLQ